MEKHNTGGGFSRPPPTSPRGHPQKKPRREGPSNPHDDAWWSRLPLASRTSFGSAEDPDNFKPLHLGDYVVKQGTPTTAEFKIRGTSLAPVKTEAEGRDSEPAPMSFRSLMSNLNSATDSIFAQVQKIESAVVRFSPTHPTPRAAAAITAQLKRLGDVSDAMSAEAEAMARDLDQLAARECELKRELDDSRVANLKLSGAERDLTEQVRVFKFAAVEAEAELRRLKREVADLGVKHESLEMDHQQLQKQCSQTEIGLKGTIRKQEGEIDKAGVENRKLQTLVQEKDDQIEGLKSDNRELQNSIQERVVEAEGVSVENTRLWALLREKEAKISAMTAGPITPLSTFAPLEGSHIQTLTPFPGSPLPYIKQEPPDHTHSKMYPHEPAPAEQPQDPAQQLCHLGTGAATILSQLFHITHPIPPSNTTALSNFLSHLGAADAPRPTPAYQPRGSPNKPWHLHPPWLPTHSAVPTLHPTLEGQFAHLCLIFPFSFPGTTASTTITPTDPETFPFLNALLSSLLRADHVAAPRAGQAFLQAMEALALGVEEQEQQQPQPQQGGGGGGVGSGGGGEGGVDLQETRTLLLTVMLGALCRRLEEVFAVSRHSHQGRQGLASEVKDRDQWHLGVFLGLKVGTVLEEKPIGRLGAALWAGGDESRTVRGVLEREMAERGFGDRFCVVERAGVGGGGGDEGPSGGMGLLHCGGEGGEFLMLDFQERAIRVVDCRLARMRPNAAEPRKLDLIVVREGGEEEEELFRVTAASRDVAAFWVRYAMGE